MKQALIAKAEALAPQLCQLSDYIWEHPEVGYPTRRRPAGC